MLRIDSIRVRKDRIIVEVVLDEGRLRTTRALVESLLPAYPHLLEHACVNEKGETFGAVAYDTAIPHLLEHMVIEEQVRLEGRLEENASPRTYVGKTHWLNRSEPRARIEVSYASDLVALHAFRIASECLNAAMVK